MQKRAYKSAKMKQIKKEKLALPAAMTVAGSDSGGGAGIQADLLTFAANGVYATSAIVALTSQNPAKITAIETCSLKSLTHQLERIVEFYKPAAAKCGMLFSKTHIKKTAAFFKKNPQIRLVVDPVFISTSGVKLLKDDAIGVVKTELLPLAEVITPNLDEACALLGIKKIGTDEMQDAARALAEAFGVNVLLKGGHLEGHVLKDVLCGKNGDILLTLKTKRLKKINSHGSGCTLSAAICAGLARGQSLVSAVKSAHKYLQDAMKDSVRVGGEYFINHFPKK